MVRLLSVKKKKYLKNLSILAISGYKRFTNHRRIKYNINRNSVPNLTSGPYWSSTKIADNYSWHYYIDYSSGMVYSAYDPDNKLNVRAVCTITQQ